MSEGRNYSIKLEGNRLIFKTPSFRAEGLSVLHKGIYNYELSSVLAASAVCGTIYILLAFNYSIVFIHYLSIAGTFIIAFIFYRRFIFRERVLTAIFDRSNRLASISYPGMIGEKTEEISFSTIESVEIGSRKILPENPDGIAFVQKISIQHGSAVPGLGDEHEFVTLLLKLTNGTERIIYAAEIEGRIGVEPETPLKEIRDFLALQDVAG